MVRYQGILAYDGTAFAGMQRQDDARTVQGDVEIALRKIGWQGRSILAAGRTDAGVHAAGQVIAFDLDWKHTETDLQNALNANLPPDAAFQSVRQTREDFHPRYDAFSRSYRYTIICQQARDPLRERFAWRVWPMPDLAVMEQCAALLEGEHDFSAFGTPPKPGGVTIRQVHQAGWQMQADTLIFEVTANAFLYHMVRRMVSIQVEIGLGKTLFSVLRSAVEAGATQTEMIQGLAPAHGLSLMKVTYPQA